MRYASSLEWFIIYFPEIVNLLGFTLIRIREITLKKNQKKRKKNRANAKKNNAKQFQEFFL